MINQREETILDRKVILTERSARAVFKQVEIETGGNGEFLSNLMSHASAISDSLKWYIDKKVPFYLRPKYRKLFSAKNLINELTIKELTRLSKIVLHDLEGLPTEDDGKKKIQNP